MCQEFGLPDKVNPGRPDVSQDGMVCEIRIGFLQRSIGVDHEMQRFFIIAGLALLAIGLFWPWLSRLPLGRLPGDINIVREGFSFHFPLMTSIVVSVLISVLLWIFRR